MEEARPQKLMQKMKEMMTKHSMSLFKFFFFKREVNSIIKEEPLPSKSARESSSAEECLKIAQGFFFPLQSNHSFF